MTWAKAERIVAAIEADLARRKGFDPHSFLTEASASEMRNKWIRIVKTGG